MIERIYIDNFRTLVNFEWKPGRLALLLGDNGSGKSSVIDVLWSLRTFVTGDFDLRRAFRGDSRTRWESRSEQRFELDVALGDARFRYCLVLSHEDRESGAVVVVARESLHEGGVPLLELGDNGLRLYSDDGTSASALPTPFRRNWSGVGAVEAGNDSRKLGVFKRWFENELRLFRPELSRMSPLSKGGPQSLDPVLHNFASWYSTWVPSDFDGALQARVLLQEAMPGFVQLQISKTAPVLQAQFQGPNGAPPYAVDFGDLSEGQRALCALWVLRCAFVQGPRTVIFDEPDNYVALREIQPWLNEVIEEASREGGPQVFLISHHPELLDQLAVDHGVRFFRDGGPTRIEPFRGKAGLTASETVARGWIDG